MIASTESLNDSGNVSPHFSCHRQRESDIAATAPDSASPWLFHLAGWLAGWLLLLRRAARLRGTAAALQTAPSRTSAYAFSGKVQCTIYESASLPPHRSPFVMRSSNTPPINSTLQGTSRVEAADVIDHFRTIGQGIQVDVK